MLYHNLLLFYRNIKRSRTTFFINMVGLSSGIACALLICLWVMDEWRFDRYHEKDDRLFQVMEHTKTDSGIETKGHTQEFLGDILAAELPEVEHAAVVTPPYFFPAFTLTLDGKHVEGTGKYVDKEFFQLFSHEFIYGSKSSALTDMNSIVLSEGMARRLFGDISKAVNTTLEYQLFHLKRNVMVTGIFRDPVNSSEHFDFLLTFDAFREIMNFNRGTLNWDGKAPFFTYVTLREGVDLDNLEAKLSRFLAEKTPNAGHRTMFLKPFSDNYLYGRYESGIATGRIEYVRLFIIIGVFVLIIACVNFMNLSTARASIRLREIGVKKVVGASRATLARQHLMESVLMAFLSMSVAILMVDLLLPHFNQITGKSLALVLQPGMVIACSTIALATGLLAGSYPALYLSALNVATVLTGKFRSPSCEMWARKGLVIFQFTLSVIFIVAVVVLYRQIEFVQSRNLGYDPDNIVYFEADGKLASAPETFLNEVRKITGVSGASSMLGNFLMGRGDTPGGGTPGVHSWNGKDVVMSVAQVNYDLIETLGIEMAAGRSFIKGHGPDTLQIIYNEAAIEALGIEDPVGRILPGGTEIVGVAKNFHFQSLHADIAPHCFMLEPDAVSSIFIKIKKGNETATLEAIQRVYKKFNPGYEFGLQFLDRNYQALYRSERQIASLAGYSAGLAILISCLGLFGLATFTAERRTREIGIRKVLGSSIFGIICILTVDFTKIVLAAIIVALPVGYFLTDQWLATFAYRIEFEWWYFGLAGAFTLMIAWITVGAQAFRAASVNPVKCLRDE